MESETLGSQQIKSWAADVGFQDCGIARARLLAEAEEDFLQSVGKGYHADMHYLERNVDDRFNPESLLPSCKSVIVVTYNYLTDSEPKSDTRLQGGQGDNAAGTERELLFLRGRIVR